MYVYYENLKGQIYEVMGSSPQGHIVVREVDDEGRSCQSPIIVGGVYVASRDIGNDHRRTKKD